jgi:predicted ATPase
VEFRILGPLEVSVAGRVVALGGHKPRTVLASLLLEVNRVVTVDRLVCDVWGEDPPPSAVNALQTYVSRLRRVLDARTLQRRQAGYLLAADPDLVDARRFERLLTEGRTALAGGDAVQAHQAIEAALALWRGPALLDMADGHFAQAEVARLTELRLVAAEARVEALLARGRTAESVAAAHALVVKHPLRERSRAHLMLSLYRDGRQAEALAKYHEARQLLVDQFGLDPGEDLATLAQAILRQDPALLADVRSASAARTAGALRSAGDVLTERLDTDPGPEREALQSAILRQDAQLLAMPERVELAAVPALEARARNLPAVLSALTGRSRELELLATLVDEHRLVTLTGTGGIGKTRLAIETARRHGGDDGPWLVELAGLHDPTLVADTVAGVLSIAANGDPAVLFAALRRRTTLIVLDNCEQIVDGVAEFVTTLLRTCPNVLVLATSREALRVEGERRYEVPPLSAGAAGEAVELFERRAAAVNPGWADGVDGALDAVARLCANLDNLPLAIELAAAQCAVLSVDQLAALAHDRFAVLRGGPRGNRRHATILATVQWSWDLLSDPEKESFTALAVFADGFDLRAAMVVTRSTDVIAHLDTLTAKSMVTVVGGNPRRYRILETLRQFAERQRTEERTADLRNRHVAWVCELADEASDALRDARSAQWMARLSVEHANIRAALDHSRGEPAVSLRICAGMYWYWYRAGHITEGLRYVRPVVEHCLTVEESDPEFDGEASGDAPIRLRILTTLGLALLSYLGGDLASVGWALAQLGRLTTRSDDPVAVSLALATIAYFEASGGQIAEAEQHAGAALRLARENGATRNEAEALMSLGTAYYRAGDLDRAAAALTASIEAAERAGHAWCYGSSSWLLAKCRVAQGRFDDEVERVLADALDRIYAEGDRTSWIVKLTTLAYVRYRRGRAENAAELLAAALHQGELIGYSPTRMDPVDLGRYVSEMTGQIDDVVLAEAAARGRTLDHPQIAFLVHDIG